jgi:hypothetical protein
MIAPDQAHTYLEQLGLAEAASVLEARLEAASKQNRAYVDFLADLLGAEAAARRPVKRHRKSPPGDRKSPRSDDIESPHRANESPHWRPGLAWSLLLPPFI